MTNYASMLKRIRRCSTKEEVDKTEVAIDRLHSAGVFTTREVLRLYQETSDQWVAIDTEIK